MPSIVKNDPWWLDRIRTARLTSSKALLGPTVPAFWVFNPAYAAGAERACLEHGWIDIMTGGMTPEAAADKAFKRIEDIFAKYPIVQS